MFRKFILKTSVKKTMKLKHRYQHEHTLKRVTFTLMYLKCKIILQWFLNIFLLQHSLIHRRYVNPWLDTERGKHFSPKADSDKSHFVMPSVEVRNERRNSAVGGRLPLPLCQARIWLQHLNADPITCRWDHRCSSKTGGKLSLTHTHTHTH